MQDRGSILSAHRRHTNSYRECTSNGESGKAMIVALIKWILIFFSANGNFGASKNRSTSFSLVFYIYLFSCYFTVPAIKHQFL